MEEKPINAIRFINFRLIGISLYSENHWANTCTQMDYVNNIILPFIRKIKRTQNLPKDQKSLCIFDMFRAQMGEDFLDLLAEKNIKVVFVPACCTDRLQPLDVSVQKAVKKHLRKSFEEWYSNQIVNQLKLHENSDTENELIDLVDLSLTKIVIGKMDGADVSTHQE